MAQYDLVVHGGSEFRPKETRTLRLTPEDDLVELGSLSIDSDSAWRILVDPRGDWVCLPLFDYQLQFLTIGPTDKLTHLQTLSDWIYSGSRASLRPDGRGIIETFIEVFGSIAPAYMRNFFVEENIGLVPTGVSHEYNSLEERSLRTVITQRGNMTAFGVFSTGCRSHHLDPEGDLSAPLSEHIWTNNSNQFFAREAAVSRDGHLLIAAGGGNEFNAVSHWISDDGTLIEMDRIPYYDRFPPNYVPLAGGNLESICISPNRDWVLFQGDATEVWDLNPDGSFGEQRWITFLAPNYGQATLSADGRVAVVSHLYLGWHEEEYIQSWALAVFRLTPEGDIISVKYHFYPHQWEVAFLTRRVPGDTNGDGWIDCSDLVTLINHVNLGAEIPNPVDFDHADVDRDGDRDEADVRAIADLILTQGTSLQN
jgi:hypothetical protein